MTIRAQLEALGVSQRVAALKLDITHRTMQRYCSGEATVPIAVTMALHLLELAQHDETQRQWLADHRAQMGFTGPDGSHVEVTDPETAKLDDRISRYVRRARKVAKKK